MYYCLINVEVNFFSLFYRLIVIVIVAAIAVVVSVLLLISRKNDTKQSREDGEAHAQFLHSKSRNVLYNVVRLLVQTFFCNSAT